MLGWLGQVLKTGIVTTRYPKGAEARRAEVAWLSARAAAAGPMGGRGGWMSRRSVFVRHLDAGSDGAAESEILALANPYYDLNRLGFFFTASPRHADLLLVTGGVTREMADPLRAAYELMPEPRAVVAAGTAACGGGIEAEGRTLGGVDRVIPVDVYCPGDPPSPLMLLHALLLAVGRAEPARDGAGVGR